MHIIVDNIMMRVFNSTVLNCNYLGGYSMKLFETRVYCSNFFLLWFDSFRLNGHAEKKVKFYPNIKHINAYLRAYCCR